MRLSTRVGWLLAGAGTVLVVQAVLRVWRAARAWELAIREARGIVQEWRELLALHRGEGAR